MRAWIAHHGLSALIHVGAWVPLALIIVDYARDALTVNPIQAVLSRTGKISLVLLVITLACTPLSTALGWRAVLRVRRALGLYGFGYAALHVATFVVLDYGLNLSLIAQMIGEKYYILAGTAAFVLLVPLAITSTRRWQQRLGRSWRSLHRLIYLAVPLAVLHFALLVKSLLGHPEPLLWAAMVGVLLLLRLPPVRHQVSQWRYAARCMLSRVSRLPAASLPHRRQNAP